MMPHRTWKEQYYSTQTKLRHGLMVLDTSTKNIYLDMTCKSARIVIKDYQIYQKDIDERIRQNLLIK